MIETAMKGLLKVAQKVFNRNDPLFVAPPDDSSDKHAPVVVNDKSRSRLYALIIGIDTYPRLKPLAGAVADAAAVEELLTVDLQVPTDHINKLVDSQATRHAIIQGFHQLRDDPRIQKDDPILIFYAGHGGLGKAPLEWRESYGYDSIQVIFPYDYDLPDARSQRNVNCIPDRTIATLLNELAVVKGNNITVIFDSCYSASANRGENIDEAVPTRIARDAEVHVDIPNDIDANIISYSKTESSESHSGHTRELRHAESPFYSNQASHIYLAACGSLERAWEEEGRGVFTAALLKSVRANGVDNITYSQLIMSLPLLPTQSPHCYGLHKTRILFNSRVPSRKITFVPVNIEQDALILQAGAVSGVTLGSVWELHAKPAEDSTALGTLIAQSPRISSTLLGLFDDKEPSVFTKFKDLGNGRLYARQIRSGTGNELRVYFSPEAKRRIFPASTEQQASSLARAQDYEVGYVVHPARDSADLIVELHQSAGHNAQSEVVYTLCEAQAQKYGIAELRKRTRARMDEVERVLFAAARWHWHLRRTNPSARSASMVSLEMVKLGVAYGDYMIPTSGLMENLNKTGIIELKAQEENQYGIRLSSQVSSAIYIHIFYFDTTDFSIVSMFGHSQANGKADPDILSRGQLMIGDEADGGAPLSFRLDSDEVLDVGYIKVFWSTDPLELGGMVQGSAFDFSESPNGPSRKVQMQDRRMFKDWGTVFVTLVQRAAR